MALQLLKENTCAKLFWNPCINVEVMAQTSSIYNHFMIWPTTDLQPTQTNVSDDISTPQGQHLCKFILKSMHKSRSYGPVELIYVIFKWTLTFNIKQEGHEALNRSPEYTGQSQIFNFEIWMIFGQGQRMTLTFDTHSTSLSHLAEWSKWLWDLRLQWFPKKKKSLSPIQKPM